MEQFHSSDIRNFAIVGHGASGKRGKIMGIDSEGGFQLINAQIAQAELHNYATIIRSLTGGRGLHSESLSHYEKMPKELEQNIIQNKLSNENE